MKKFTRLYDEGGDVLNNFYPTGAVGMTSAFDGEKKKKCRGGKCGTKQPPGVGGNKTIKWKGSNTRYNKKRSFQ